MTEAFAAFAAIMSIVNFVALACIDYKLKNRYYASNIAPAGRIWLCGACGKTTLDKYGEDQ
jgi:hypothetical protein